MVARMRTLRCSVARLAAAAAGAGVAAAQGGLWIVDDAGGPGSHFVTVQEAIIAAAEGDVILVRAGFYDPFTIQGQSLTVVADHGVFLNFNYTTQVRGLAAGQRVLLSGLYLGPTDLALEVQSNGGVVWLHDCRVETDSIGHQEAHDAAHVDDSATLIVSRSQVFSPNQPGGGSGCLAQNSNLVAYDSQFGGGVIDFPGEGGGRGLELSGGSLLAIGCHFSGGNGADGGDFGICIPGGDGGAGLALVDAGATLRECTASAGNGGSAFGEPCGDGSPGTAISTAGSASVQTWMPAARHAQLPRVLRPGVPAAFGFDGEPGDLAIAVLGTGFGSLPFAPFAGAIVPTAPWFVLATVPLDGAGNGSLPVAVPTLPGGTPVVMLYGQALFHSPSEGLLLGTPFASALLGAGF
jgi:hypothetical protein